MDDDFNTPILISHLFQGVTFINQFMDNTATLSASDLERFSKRMSDFVFEVLGLEMKPAIYDTHGEKLSGTIN